MKILLSSFVLKEGKNIVNTSFNRISLGIVTSRRFLILFGNVLGIQTVKISLVDVNVLTLDAAELPDE
jgi:hypothetical protein